MSEILSHEIAGSGEPLLLLNGGLMTMAAWVEIAARLQTDFTVIRCDLRGQLHSPGDPPPDVEGHAADVVRLLDALGFDAVHLVGTSFGGFVAATIAATAPERALSLTAIAITDTMTEEMKEGGRLLGEAASRAAEGGDREVLLDLILPTTFSASFVATHAARFAAQRAAASFLPVAYYRGVAAIADALDSVDLRPLLPKVRCRTLIVAGSEDRLFPLPHSRAVAAGITGARLKVIDGPHGLVVERPGEVVAAIREFLVPESSVDRRTNRA